MNIYAEKLKHALMIRGWSQADLARRTGLDPGHISRYVNGKISPQRTNFKKILDSLEMTERDFMAGGESSEPDPAKVELLCEVDILLELVKRLVDSHKAAMSDLTEAHSGPGDERRRLLIEATRCAVESKIDEVKRILRPGSPSSVRSSRMGQAMAYAGDN